MGWKDNWKQNQILITKFAQECLWHNTKINWLRAMSWWLHYFETCKWIPCTRNSSGLQASQIKNERSLCLPSIEFDHHQNNSLGSLHCALIQACKCIAFNSCHAIVGLNCIGCINWCSQSLPIAQYVWANVCSAPKAVGKWIENLWHKLIWVQTNRLPS